jgi:MerR family transcriptional regulator, light-induced transcriptional regulator
MPNAHIRSAIHPMRVVCQRTGLTPDLLRAWERRYRAVAPGRSAGGQRLYADADIERLQLLVRATGAGRQIGQVAALSNEELRALIEGDERAARINAPSPPGGPAVESLLSSALIAVEEFDGQRLHRMLRSAAMRLPADELLDQVIGPLLFTVGSLWHQGLLPPANEHLATTTIRRILSWMSELAAPGADAPVVVVGTPANQLHELGAMLAATTASGHGWRVVYLGANLPADELARAARFARADALALSLVYPEDDPAMPAELRRLRAQLPAGTALVVGGSGAGAYEAVLTEIGADVVPSLAAMRHWLKQRAISALAGRAARS